MPEQSTGGHPWRDWPHVRPHLSEQDIAAMEQAGNLRVEGDRALLLRGWSFEGDEQRTFDALTATLRELGWTVEGRTPLPEMIETLAEARLVAPAGTGAGVIYAEFFMPRRYERGLALRNAMAIHKACGEPFLLLPPTMDADSAGPEQVHDWDLLAGGQVLHLETSPAALAEEIGRALRSTGTGVEPGSVDYRTGMVPLHDDRPARTDRLGRRVFARALATRLRRVVSENRETARAGRSGFDRPFMVQLHAPWGAGKTTLLDFLGDELATPAGEHPPWVVVRFNAWQNQRLDPPWWSLLDAVFRDATGAVAAEPYGAAWRWPRSAAELWQVPGALVANPKIRAARVWLGEQYRRLSKAWAHVILAIGVLAWGLFLAASWGWLGDGAITGDRIRLASAVLGLILTIWGGVTAFGRTLFRGSAQAAASFQRYSEDPMRQVSSHFQRLVDGVGRDMVVFVDDIDRCGEAYVTRLMEVIQNLFYHPRVVFVVAGDRRWLNVCFERAFQPFVADVAEPGRRLGTLFLEKAFQLSIGLPRLTEHQQRAYWNHLLRVSSGDAEQLRLEAQRQASERLAGAKSEHEAIQMLGSARDDSVLDQALREEAVARLADQDMERSAESFLAQFATLLEPNPRAMKRYVSAYAVYRDVAILSHLDFEADPDRRRKLALWVIVALRWPRLEERLVVDPLLADAIGAGEAPQALADTSLQGLLDSQEVRNVFSGAIVGTRIESADVRVLAQLSTSIGIGHPPVDEEG